VLTSSRTCANARFHCCLTSSTKPKKYICINVTPTETRVTELHYSGTVLSLLDYRIVFQHPVKTCNKRSSAINCQTNLKRESVAVLSVTEITARKVAMCALLTENSCVKFTCINIKPTQRYSKTVFRRHLSDSPSTYTSSGYDLTKRILN